MPGRILELAVNRRAHDFAAGMVTAANALNLAARRTRYRCPKYGLQGTPAWLIGLRDPVLGLSCHHLEIRFVDVNWVMSAG